MNLIAHRGNLTGPDPDNENSPEKIERTRKMGFAVEVDIWYDPKHGWWLGHDAPKYPVDSAFLFNDVFDLKVGRIFFHAKNVEALVMLNRVRMDTYFEPNDFFWHEEDEYTLTGAGFIWAYAKPDVLISNDVIVAMPENAKLTRLDLEGIWGVCTDYPLEYKVNDNERKN